MIAYRSPHKARLLKQRLLEASMECLWIPARCLFVLWIRLTPAYNTCPQEQVSPHTNPRTS